MVSADQPEAEVPLFDPASFRDRSARVFLHQQQILRAVTADGLSDWQFAESLPFVRRAMSEGRLIPTQIATDVITPPAADLNATEFAGVLRHERLPLISYPYEWCFSMLRDAALLQLSLMQESLAEGAILKDASPFNIQFRGVQPIFIDTSSLTRIRDGRPWDGYQQFCQMFLFPLMLQAYRGVDFHPFLRGRLAGIETTQMASLMSIRDLFRRGVFSHVWLHSRLSRSDIPESSKNQRTEVPQSLGRAGFQSSLIASNVRALTRIVRGLKWRRDHSMWSHYDSQPSPVQKDGAAKEAFVRQSLSGKRWKQVWDIGCNLGRYSRIAAEHADVVLAMDADHVTIDRLYQDLKTETGTRVTPLVMNLADPSPSLGWRCLERTPLPDRSRPDLILCLAVIHHLVFRENLLLEDVINWLAGLNASLIIEYIDREDPQLQSLLANRDDQFTDYNLSSFTRLLSRRFRTLQQATLPSTTRQIFFVEPI